MRYLLLFALLELSIAQVVVIQRWLRHVAKEDAVDVSEKDVSRIAEDTDVILNVERELEIVAPG